MTGLSATLSNLARYRRLPTLLHGGLLDPPLIRPGLACIDSFGDNPGALRMFTLVPESLPANAPLVVVLHGCGQAAGAIAHGTGWSTLAERHGFALLLPEQRRGNNAGGCFNWFTQADIARGKGEAASIAAMIGHMLATHALDPRRVFVTGLSAGGAFANVMLAAYPDLFTAGAIIAGLPYGAATNTQSALELMFHGQRRPDRAWGDLIRAANPHPGPWPRVSVWQGLADTTVAPVNATDIVKQWLDVQGIAYATMRREIMGTADHLMWSDAIGAPAVELVTIPKLTHGVPISAKDPDPDLRCGKPAPYILESGLSSTALIARSWGLTRRQATPPPQQPEEPTGVAAIIQKALKAAGLVQ